MQLFHPLADFAKAGFLRIIGVLSSRLLPAAHWHRHHRYYESLRLLASHHSGFPIQVIPSLPQSLCHIPGRG
nr:hypothetical protein GZ28G7_31 [uncultured archaeon GZfos28G7]